MKKKLTAILIALFVCFTFIKIPLTFAEENVTLTMDSEITDNTIIVSGKVLKGEFAGKGTSPFLQVLDSNNDVKESYQWNDPDIAPDGSISTTIKTKYYSNGEYTIKVTAKGATPYTKSFSKTNGNPNDGSENGGEKPEPSIPTPEPSTPIIPTPKPVDPTIPVEPSPTPDPTVKPDAPKVNNVTSESLNITGTANPGITIRITDHQYFAKETVAQSNGTFTITLDKKFKAGTILYAIAKAGDKESKETKIIVIDKTPPKKPILKQVTDKDKKVTGKAEEGAIVTVKIGKKLLGTATVDQKGQFSIPISPQEAGKVLSVTAKDNGGNISIATKVTVLDKTAPKAPSVNKVKKSSTKVTGKAEAGSKVYIKVGKKIIGLSTVSKKGIFTVKIKKQKVNTKLVVYVKDQAGNMSKATVIKVTK